MENITLTNQDYADISNAVYDSNQYLKNHIARNLATSKNMPIIIPQGSENQFFIHMVKSDVKTEFQGYLLEKVDTVSGLPTGEFVLAYCGSYSIKDWQENFRALNHGQHEQMQAVIGFTERATQYAQELSARAGTNLSLTNVGHSLGGAEAIMGHTVNGARTFTFNPLNPDVLDVYRERKHLVNRDVIVNHTRAFDVANAVSKEPLPGTTITYATPDDEERLKKYGYFTKTNWDDSPILALINDTAKGSSHVLFDFIGENSVLKDNTARERAEKLSKYITSDPSESINPIAEFRKDVANRKVVAQYSGVFLLGSMVLDLVDVKRDVQEGWENLKNFFKNNDVQKLFNNQTNELKDHQKESIPINQNNSIENKPESKSTEPVSISPQAQKLFQQYDEKFTAFCEKRGITADCKEDFENLRGAAVATALANGLPNIEKVDIDQNRVLWMGSYNPRPQVISISTDEAVNIPVSESMAKIQHTEQQLAEERQMLQNQSQQRGMS